MKKNPEKKQDNMEIRPPVVVILGHVDHGKTSILDYIRKAHIAEKEAGGITQHIGAYQIEHQGKIITFIDTPGHEAFSAMRSRGAKVADIAVLVVAAEEGIKPQTKEAINHIKKSGLPLIVALNKIDKKEAQPEKVKRELKDAEIVVESLGGQVPSINVSAKTGQSIDELLEMINLVAEMEELKSNPDKPASGVIIESRLDSLRGPTATLLVKDGTLKNIDIIGTGSAFGRIKTMEDFRIQVIKETGPSAPVIVTGFNQVPQIGEKFDVFENSEAAQKKVEQKTAKRKEEKEVFFIPVDKKVLNILLKADVRGSLEAIRESLQAIPQEEIVLRVLKSEVGEINENDIKLAQSGQAKIIGFRVKTSSKIQQIAEQQKVKILTFEIIYELIQKTRDLLAGLLAPEIIKNVLGQLKVLAIFPAKKGRQIIGGKVTNGQIKRGAFIEIIRENKRIGKGKLIQLQHNKKDVEEVAKNQECGIMFEGGATIEERDIIEVYEEEKKKREL
ncbi:MAG: translation initiation factor IF-2 [Candidatus Portnoybacteria bacterium RIFCSPLOWO2_01_FULL_43_11]|uniref:Translation initiation factor IF-2 n=4 Tax=Candidatus Portnoyibacteriota TaxID=1817913 RepID=A0A1G2FBH5_9BACT|nr:MAG: translation initiation factor IF-2 [Candidatus Portnoybacteria bacterium RIFCSPHIGHO2_01_FULL_40_12b]OGZ37027.1 MAG: translation initiation factor IF-2 [Candidatus Portnoybacteria bacterium RIFCSPHIGHO2_02_FULL_40_23]OGZ38038.1 MAG: translation initiation factor IF-2 [Candidatus Portnoybacteria bacterium RIFCSPHIGHO2_12_FULL_40_11]OGZ38612.1 MAG: translation initiation factor IF-2 [Candidatus Portnoybacteria bacterium RIFCSPLOWO2_01_FULL_43_11]OGZ40622.1 MAG: translation initiation fact